MSYSTTLRKLRDKRVDTEVYNHLIKQLGPVHGDDTEIPLVWILAATGLDDTLRALRACDLDADEEKQIRSLACDYAERVLYIFENCYPYDMRPRECIETTRKWIKGEAIDADLDAACAVADAVANAAHMQCMRLNVYDNYRSHSHARWLAAAMAALAVSSAVRGDYCDVARSAACARIAVARGTAATERAWQAQKLREVVGEPSGENKRELSCERVWILP